MLDYLFLHKEVVTNYSIKISNSSLNIYIVLFAEFVGSFSAESLMALSYLSKNKFNDLKIMNTKGKSKLYSVQL